MFDYRTPVLKWPDWVRVRWPNTIAAIVLIDRFAPMDRRERIGRGAG